MDWNYLYFSFWVVNDVGRGVRRLEGWRRLVGAGAALTGAGLGPELDRVQRPLPGQEGGPVLPERGFYKLRN